MNADEALDYHLMTINWDEFHSIFESGLAGLKSLSQMLTYAREQYMTLYNRRKYAWNRQFMNSGRNERIPNFFEGKMWEIILKKLGSALLEYVPRSVVMPSVEELFVPSNDLTLLYHTSTHGLFTVSSIKWDIDYCWNKYLVALDADGYWLFLDNVGEINYIDPFGVRLTTHSHLFFLIAYGNSIEIYTDTPWNDEYLIFSIELDKSVNELIDASIIESMEGVILTLLYQDNMGVDWEDIHLVDFRNNSLRLLRKIHYEGESIIRLGSSRYIYKGIGYSYIEGRKTKELTNVTGIRPTGMTGIDFVIENSSTMNGYLYDFIKNGVLYRITNPLMMFDSFAVFKDAIKDIMTGEVLFSVDSTSIIGITRKEDNTGYIVWLYSDSSTIDETQ